MSSLFHPTARETLARVSPGRPIGPDWLGTPAGPVGQGPEPEWAWGELTGALATGSGSGVTLLDPPRYGWYELAPGNGGVLDRVSDVRGSELLDFVIPLTGTFPEDPTGMRVLLRRAHPGYWVAVAMATAAVELPTDWTRAVSTLECLDAPVTWYQGYIRDYGAYGPTLFGAEAGSGETPTRFSVFASSPRYRARSYYVRPDQVRDASLTCRGDALGGVCDADSVGVPCCLETVPQTLYLTISAPTIPCLDGTIVTLIWDGLGWVGSTCEIGPYCDPTSVNRYLFSFQCLYGTNSFLLSIANTYVTGLTCIGNDPLTGCMFGGEAMAPNKLWGSRPASASCSPAMWVFTDVFAGVTFTPTARLTFGEQGYGGCSSIPTPQPVTITITE